MHGKCLPWPFTLFSNLNSLIMNNLLKRINLFTFTVILLCTFISPTVGLNSAPSYETTTCDPPTNVSVTSQSQGQVSFGWDSVDEETTYRIWYQREGDNNPGPARITSNNYVDFQSLPSGTYTFYFVRLCGNGTSSLVIVDDLIML